MSERRYVRIPVSFLVYVFALLSGGAIGASIVLVAVDAFRAAPAVLLIALWVGLVLPLIAWLGWSIG